MLPPKTALFDDGAFCASIRMEILKKHIATFRAETTRERLIHYDDDDDDDVEQRRIVFVAFDDSREEEHYFETTRTFLCVFFFVVFVVVGDASEADASHVIISEISGEGGRGEKHRDDECEYDDEYE